MDSVRGFGDDRFDKDDDAANAAREQSDAAQHGGVDTHIAVGTDERRMHVRAYNHWVSLLGGRAYPSIEDLDPANIADFGPHSVLLDFSLGIENPAIAFLGQALRAECSLDSSVSHISEVPSRSLLSRLTDHYLQIIANRSPIGFEAEFVSSRGHNTLYRGILMPFSSDDDTIDFVYGVINWKELVDAATQTRLNAEIAAAVSSTPVATPAAPVWADGPSAVLTATAPAAIASVATAPFATTPTAIDSKETTSEPYADTDGAANLADHLMLAQQTAAAVRAADVRGRATLYRALARAHDFALAADADPRGYGALLAAAAIAVQLRAPMTPIVKLVFGSDYDKTRLTEYAAVLSYARRIGLGTGQLGAMLEGFAGGIKGVVKAERAARTPVAKPGPRPRHATLLAARPALAHVAIDAPLAHGGYLVLLARAGERGMLDIVATLGNDAALTARVMAKAV